MMTPTSSGARESGAPRLTRAFYARPSTEVAPKLLGKFFVRQLPDGLLRARIVETEAYTGWSDPGSHAYRGRTARNAVMFDEAGHLYVYLSYGMHFCLNVVTDEPGIAGAVLIRALEPLEGISIMEANRHGRPFHELCNGPGKLCQAFGITRAQNGADLEDSDIWIEDDGSRPPEIATSTRVGLSAGADLPLRYFLPDSPYVSPGRPSHQ